MRGNIYTCQNLCALEHECHDVSALKLFELAAMDDGSDPVIRIIEHSVGTLNHKKSYDFLVEFRSGLQRWLPYMEVRN